MIYIDKLTTRKLIIDKTNLLLTFRCDPHTGHQLQLVGRSQLYLDVVSAFRVVVMATEGGGDVEGHAVVLGKDSDLVGTYFVGRVPVPRHTVRAHHHSC